MDSIDKPMHTTFIIVTFQSAHTLESCLNCLLALDDCSILVVDNGSCDDSRDVAATLGVPVMALDGNRGFAAAANHGARHAAGPLLCFLNPDCLIDAATLHSARSVLTAEPSACAVPDFQQGGETVIGRQPGYTWRKVLADVMENNARSPKWIARLRSHPAHHNLRWHWALGACFFIMATRFLTLGGFDERYFLYMEDVDFGWRLHQAGGHVVALPSRVVHGGAQGADVPMPQRLQLLNTARTQFARRHYGLLMGWLTRWMVRS